MRMIVNSPAAVAAAFSKQLQAHVAGGQRLRRDARADHDRGEERRAEQLGEQAAGERLRVHDAAILLH